MLLGKSLPPDQTTTATRLRVCHTITSIESRFGGPARSVPSLAVAQQSLGVEVGVFTLGYDATGTNAAGVKPAPIEVFDRGWPMLTGRGSGLRRALNATAVDAVHHHGLWHRTLHYAHRKARRDRVPLIVSPRGMLMPWALAHHGGRKRLAAALFHPGALASASGWHATSEAEAEAIRAAGYPQPICIAPNGVTLPSLEDLARAHGHWERSVPATEGRRVALFYSRFHRKKRVLELIDLWMQIGPPDWALILVGIPEEYSVAELEQRIRERGAAAQISVRDGTHAPAPYAMAELFLLPTHSENFGMVVAEALAHGVPALVTDQMPWSDLAERGAGWSEPWGAPFRSRLEECLRLPPDQLRAMGQRGAHWMNESFSWSAAARKLIDFYHSLIR